MRPGPLARLIDGAEWNEFLQIAQRFIELHLGLKTAIVDGRDDGGSDLRIYSDPKTAARVAVQVSVRRAWAPKALEDARKAKASHGATMFYFISSTRVTPTQRVNFQRDVRERLAMQADTFGNQEVASRLLEASQDRFVLDCLGIETTTAGARPLSLRDRALYSYSFVSSDATDFRKNVTDQTILAVLSERGSGVARGELVEAVTGALGLGDDDRRYLSGRVDALVQNRSLSGVGDTIDLAPETRTYMSDLATTFGEEWQRYRTAIGQRLVELGWSNATGDQVEEVAQSVADSLIARSLLTAQEAEPSVCIGVLLRGALEFKTRLDVVLSRTPLRSDPARAAVGLGETASRFAIAREASAAALHFSLQRARRQAVIAALTGSRVDDLEAYLDASVAIPWLASKLYTRTSAFLAAVSADAVEVLEAHGARIGVPSWYVEECATHYLMAWNYVDLAEEDQSSLAESQNGFVSHYYGMPEGSRPGTLADFLEGIAGVVNKTGDFDAEKRRVIGEVRRIVHGYGVEPVLIPHPRDNARADIQKAVTWTLREEEKKKPTILLDHDVAVLAFLQGRVLNGREGVLLVTWDGTLVKAAQNRGDCGWVLRASSVLDLFSASTWNERPPAELARRVFAGTTAGKSGVVFLDGVLQRVWGKRMDAQWMQELRARKSEVEKRIGRDDPEWQTKCEREVARFLREHPESRQRSGARWRRGP